MVPNRDDMATRSLCPTDAVVEIRDRNFLSEVEVANAGRWLSVLRPSASEPVAVRK
jgi:hypothetical protein